MKFPLKLASIEVDESKKGWGRYKISLGNDIRKRHLDDPVQTSSWSLTKSYPSKILALECTRTLYYVNNKVIE